MKTALIECGRHGAGLPRDPFRPEVEDDFPDLDYGVLAELSDARFVVRIIGDDARVDAAIVQYTTA